MTVQKVNKKIKFLHNIKRQIPENVFKTLVNAYIDSIIDYGIELWCVIPDYLCQKLQQTIDHLLITYTLPSLSRRRSSTYYNLYNNKNITKIRDK